MISIPTDGPKEKINLREIDAQPNGNGDGKVQQSEFNRWFKKKFDADGNQKVDSNQLRGYAEFFGLPYGSDSNFSQWWNLGARLGDGGGLEINSAAMTAWNVVSNYKFGWLENHDTTKDPALDILDNVNPPTITSSKVEKKPSLPKEGFGYNRYH